MLSLSLLLSISLAAPAVAVTLSPPVIGASKGGVPIAVSTTSASWNTAVLQLRLPADEVSPQARASTMGFVGVLADAGAKVLGSAGRVQARVTADLVTIAFGATADQPELPLRAVDAALRALKTTKPVAAVMPAPFDAVDDDLDVDSAALLLPGKPAGLPIDGVVIDAANFKALAATVRSDRGAVGVVGAGTAVDVLARAVKLLTTAVPKAPAAAAAVVLDDKHSILVERRQDASPTTTLTWWTSSTSVADRAAALVLAEFLGGRLARGAGRLGIVAVVSASDRATLLAAENQRADTLKKLTTAPPTTSELSTATTAAIRNRLSRLDDPTRLAHSLSRGLLNDDDVAGEVAAIDSTTAAAVTAAAIRFGAGVQLSRRFAPAALPAAPVQKTTTTTTTTTTTGAKR